MGLDFRYSPGQTPIDEDEKVGLLIPNITSVAELNEFEQQNIEKAIEWCVTRKFSQEQILSDQFLRALHAKMFGDVWAWAGEFRRSNKNLGCDWQHIGTQLKQLLDDSNYWISKKTYPEEEIAIRFKHRLVSIHCFPNGNGRHSRLMADIIITHIFKKPVFTWGGNLNKHSDPRSVYIKAVKDGDNGNMKPLLKFARS